MTSTFDCTYIVTLAGTIRSCVLHAISSFYCVILRALLCIFCLFLITVSALNKSRCNYYYLHSPSGNVCSGFNRSKHRRASGVALAALRPHSLLLR